MFEICFFIFVLLILSGWASCEPLGEPPTDDAIILDMPSEGSGNDNNDTIIFMIDDTLE
jgi:hypothetical protein